MNKNISFFLKRGVLLIPEVIDNIDEKFIRSFEKNFDNSNKPLVIN